MSVLGLSLSLLSSLLTNSLTSSNRDTLLCYSNDPFSGNCIHFTSVSLPCKKVVKFATREQRSAPEVTETDVGIVG